MWFFGLKINVKRQPGLGSRVAVIEESLESHKLALDTLIIRMGLVEKKAEATRRKVYRVEEEGVPSTDHSADQPVPEEIPSALGPGDPIPPGFKF